LEGSVVEKRLAAKDGGGSEGTAAALGDGLVPVVAVTPTIKVKVVGGPTTATSSGESSSYRSFGSDGEPMAGWWQGGTVRQQRRRLDYRGAFCDYRTPKIWTSLE
jgi:hypothetical protein